MKLLHITLMLSLCIGTAYAVPVSDEDPFSKKNIGVMQRMYQEQEDVFWIVFSCILLHDPEILDRQQWVSERIIEGHQRSKIDMEEICRKHAGINE